MTFPPIVDLNPEKQRSGMLRIADYWTTLKGADSMKTYPPKDEFEAELANVLRQRLAEQYGCVYEIECRRDQRLFLVCVGTVAVTGFLCACLLWVFLP